MGTIKHANGVITKTDRKGKIITNTSTKGSVAPTAAVSLKNKPTLAKFVNEEGKYSRESAEGFRRYKPPTEKAPKNAKFGTVSYILKQLAEANEKQILATYKDELKMVEKRVKVFDEYGRYDGDDTAWNVAYDAVYTKMFNSTVSLQNRIEKIEPYNDSGLFNGYAIEAFYGTADAVALALLARKAKKISEKDYDTLTKPWRTHIGAIHPDDKDIFKGKK